MRCYNTNRLEGSYAKYQQRQVKSLVEQISKEQRAQVLETIKARAAILGAQNELALKSALKHLRNLTIP